MTWRPIAFVATTLLFAAVMSGRSQARQAPSAQTPALPARAPSGLVSGQVVDGNSGQPLAGATVALNGRGGLGQRVLVDARGRFLFSGLPASPYTIAAAKLGYFGGAAGARDPQSVGRPIELGDAERFTDLTLRLWKYGAASGTVSGDGEPAVGLEVDALRRALVGGAWRLVPNAVTTSDDHGRYRLGGLLPGAYVLVARPAQNPETSLLLTMLSANPDSALDVLAGAMTTEHQGPEFDARVKNYPWMFYPAAVASSRATVVTVEAGQERTGLDFHLQKSPLVRVAGTLANLTGTAEGMTVRLVPAEADADGTPLDVAVTACDSDGRFEFSGVTPGRYIVKVVALPAQAPATPPSTPPGRAGPAAPAPVPALPKDPTLWARLPLVVGNAPVSGLSVPLQTGFAVKGRVELEGVGDRPTPDQLAQIIIRLDPADQPAPAGPAAWRGRVEPDGQFETMGVPPGRYLLRASATLRGWTIQSAMSAGRDALDVPIEIGASDVTGVGLALVNRPLATLSGTVRDDHGAAQPATVVLVFPTDHSLWTDSGPLARRFRIARPTQAGAFTVGGLPAGEYFAVATDDDLPPDWQDPRRLDVLSSRATRVRIARGDTQILDLKAGK